MEDQLPFAGLKVIDETMTSGRGSQRVEVWLEGRPIAQLPVTGVTYRLDPTGIGKASIDLFAESTENVGLLTSDRGAFEPRSDR